MILHNRLLSMRTYFLVWWERTPSSHNVTFSFNWNKGKIEQNLFGPDHLTEDIFQTEIVEDTVDQI